MRKPLTSLLLITLSGCLAAVLTYPASSDDDVLRYVSLAAGEANLRTGPNLRYPIDWVYQRRGLPLAVTDERETWRRVRDADGIEGWMHVSLLTGRRTAQITGATRSLYDRPLAGARTVMTADAGVIGRLERCSGLWCRLVIDGTSGWIERRHLFGVGRDETVN